MASVTPSQASQVQASNYNRLPHEVRLILVEKAVDSIQAAGHSLAPFACIDACWQEAVEKVTFASPRLQTVDDIAIFENLWVGKRLTFISHIHFNLRLDFCLFSSYLSYDVFDREAPAIIVSCLDRVLAHVSSRDAAKEQHSGGNNDGLITLSCRNMLGSRMCVNTELQCDFSSLPVARNVGALVLTPPRACRAGVGVDAAVSFTPASVDSLLSRLPNVKTFRFAEQQLSKGDVYHDIDHGTAGQPSLIYSSARRYERGGVNTYYETRKGLTDVILLDWRHFLGSLTLVSVIDALYFFEVCLAFDNSPFSRLHKLFLKAQHPPRTYPQQACADAFVAFRRVLAAGSMPSIESVCIALEPPCLQPYMLHFGEKRLLEWGDGVGWGVEEWRDDGRLLQVRCHSSALEAVWQVQMALRDVRGRQLTVRWQDSDEFVWSVWDEETSSWMVEN